MSGEAQRQAAEEAEDLPFAVGFIGRSGSGKTTYCEQVTAILKSRGYRVGVLKDAHHGFDMDTPGKDSWRYREAGAAAVAVRSDARWAMLVETPEREPVEAMLRRFRSVAGGVDLVLVEGFKHEGAFPKIEVRRRGCAAEPPLAAGEVALPAAVASDFDEPGIPPEIPRLDLNRPEEAADFILALMRRDEKR